MYISNIEKARYPMSKKETSNMLTLRAIKQAISTAQKTGRNQLVQKHLDDIKSKFNKSKVSNCNIL